jgi:transposase
MGWFRVALAADEQVVVQAERHAHPAAHVRRKMLVLWLLHCGLTRVLAADIAGVGRATVERYAAAYRDGGLDGLRRWGVTGSTPRLTDDQIRELGVLLAEGAVAHGWVNNLWTAARVAEVIQKRFGVEYHSLSHVSAILRERLNWSCQRPRHHHKDRDDAAIALWVKEEFPAIAASAAARRAHLVFIDEAGFMLVPTVRRTYAPRGQPPVHRTGDQHGRISCIGAIAISPGRDCIRLRYTLLADQVNFRGPSVVQFLRNLRSEFGPMTVVWDQIPIHECSSVVAFLAANRDVELEPFPPYAPELNPADGIWRYIKYGRLSNYTPYEMDELRGKVVAELSRLKKCPGLLKSFVRFAKLPIQL